MPAPAIAPAIDWVPAYVGLGSNLDDPERQVQDALRALPGLPGTRLMAMSRSLRNPALGPQPQPEFVNAVAGLLTRLPPVDLLDALLAIERRQGRDRRSGIRWGPRRIDLDLLVYGEVTMDTDRLTIPHPGIASRNFVLFPLLEIAPGLRIPGLGPVRRLAAAVNQPEETGQVSSSWGTPVTSQ
jgi:2-amino-4-hydroxy-6-hydroxymethyldihydropteridine diphosphokinase